MPNGPDDTELSPNIDPKMLLSEAERRGIVQPSGPSIPATLTDAEVAAIEEEEKQYDNPFLASSLGVARGLTFGLSDWVATSPGLLDKEYVRKLREHHGGLSMATELGGAVLPMLFTGGTSALATGVRGAGSLVRGAAAAGKGTTLLANKAIQQAVVSQATKRILSKTIAKPVGSAVEAMFYGLGQVNSEMALGSPTLSAESAVATVGLSGLLGGAAPAVFGAGSKLVGKATYSLGKLPGRGGGIAKKVYAKIRGLEDPEILTRVYNDIDSYTNLEKLAGTPGDAFIVHSDNKAIEYSEKLTKFLNDVIDNKKAILQELDESGLLIPMKSRTKKVTSWFDEMQAIRNEYATNKRKEAIATVKEIDLMINEVREMGRANIPKDTLRILAKEQSRKAGRPVSINDVDVRDEDLMLTASQWYKKKNEWFGVSGKAGKAPTFKLSFKKDAWGRAHSASRKLLADVDDRIAAEDLKLAKLKGFQDDFKELDLSDWAVDEELIVKGIRSELNPDKFRRIFTPAKMKSTRLRQAVEWIDENVGTDIAKTQQLLSDFKVLHPADAFSKWPTGKSLYFLGGGATLSFIPGAQIIGPALGVAATIAQAPMATMPLIRAARRISGMTGGSVAGQAAGKGPTLTARAVRAFSDAFKRQSVPYAAGLAGYKVVEGFEVARRVHALGNLERMKLKQKNDMEDSVDKLFERRSAPTFNLPKSPSVLASVQKQWPADRVERYREIRDNLETMVADIATLGESIANSTKDVQRAAPVTADAIMRTATNAVTFLTSKLPVEQNAYDVYSGRSRVPTDTELGKFDRYYNAVIDPSAVINGIASGMTTPEAIEALREVYPETYNELLFMIADRASKSKEGIPYSTRVMLSMLTGAGVDSSMRPETIMMLQGISQEAEQEAQTRLSSPKMRMAGVDKIDAAERMKPQSSRPEFR